MIDDGGRGRELSLKFLRRGRKKEEEFVPLFSCSGRWSHVRREACS